MFVYRLHVNPLLDVDVKLDASSSEENGPLRYEAVPKQANLPDIQTLVDMVKDEVRALTGIDGHLLGDVTTPVDLNAAFAEGGLSRYRPELIEGQQIL